MWGIIRLPNERVGRCVKQDKTAYNLKDKGELTDSVAVFSGQIA